MILSDRIPSALGVMLLVSPPKTRRREPTVASDLIRRTSALQ